MDAHFARAHAGGVSCTMKFRSLICFSSLVFLGCQPQPVNVLDLKYDRAVNIVDQDAMKELEKLFVANGVTYNLRKDGYIQYSTHELALVRRLERIANPPPPGFCCVELLMSREKSTHFASLLDSNEISYRKIKTIYGEENIAWEREDELLVDQIVQKLEIKCIEEFEQKHAYCN